MDNQDKIKFKEAGNGYFIKIDDKGNESASFNKGKPGTSAAGLWKEKQAWIDAGYTVEPQFTAEELAAKDQAEADAEAIAWIGNREAEYPTQKELTIALWERVIEGRPEASDALEVKRQAVKLKHPEP